MTQGDGSEQPVALLLPGRRYTVDHPVLYYVAEVARDLGWRTIAVEWDPLEPSDESVISRGRDALRALPAGRSIVIGKSLGSLSAASVADLSLPAIWLTPVLTHAGVRDGVARSTAGSLLVGGTADAMWDSAFARSSGHQVLELEGGDHRLQLPGDAVGSAAFLATLTECAHEFLAGATRSSSDDDPSRPRGR